MRTTKLVINQRTALPVEQRQNIRAAVYALEKRAACGDLGNIAKELASVASRVGRLGSFHAKEGRALKKRLSILRQAMEHLSAHVVTLAAPNSTAITTKKMRIHLGSDNSPHFSK
ncbi:hypothetical protein [Janthinobacterium lividum]|uniref:hypothetical protein n=1 Tax=Janthinobacterium lividum TaxID=29581 RepID=UPI002093B6BB|nr:hypothetical protein [Janthinobacterium lividum]